MPTLTRWYIKSGLIYFIAALTVGIMLKLPQTSSVEALLPALLPVYFHLFMVGWITELIFGVSFWMFPRHTPEHPRGNIKLAWGTFVTLNIGLLLRLVAEPLSTVYSTSFASWLLILSAILQWLAGFGYVFHIWARVKPK